eukprot:1509493-Pleurochrysis_carterae.AAC.3
MPEHILLSAAEGEFFSEYLRTLLSPFCDATASLMHTDATPVLRCARGSATVAYHSRIFPTLQMMPLATRASTNSQH